MSEDAGLGVCSVACPGILRSPRPVRALGAQGRASGRRRGDPGLLAACILTGDPGRSGELTTGRSSGSGRRLRLDKFLMLVRRFVSRTFALLSKSGWKPGPLQSYLGFLADQVLLKKDDDVIALGLNYHLCDVFVPELLSCCAREGPLPAAAVLPVLEPFIKVLLSASKSNTAYINRVREGVFEALVAELRDPAREKPLRHLTLQALHDLLFEVAASEGEPTFPGGRLPVYVGDGRAWPESDSSRDLPSACRLPPAGPRGHLRALHGDRGGSEEEAQAPGGSGRGAGQRGHRRIRGGPGHPSVVRRSSCPWRRWRRAGGHPQGQEGEEGGQGEEGQEGGGGGRPGQGPEPHG